VKLKASKNAETAVNAINAVIFVRRMVEAPVGLLSWYWGKNVGGEIFGERSCPVHFDDENMFLS
jgi:hypothetical protein